MHAWEAGGRRGSRLISFGPVRPGVSMAVHPQAHGRTHSHHTNLQAQPGPAQTDPARKGPARDSRDTREWPGGRRWRTLGETRAGQAAGREKEGLEPSSPTRLGEGGRTGRERRAGG
jgi:hypothetical protein